MKKRKFLSILATLVMTASLSVPVFADQVSGDAVTATSLTRDLSTTINAQSDGSWSIELGVFISEQGNFQQQSDIYRGGKVDGTISGSTGVILSKNTWEVSSTPDTTTYSTEDKVTASGTATSSQDYTVTFTANSDETGISRGADTVTIHVVVPTAPSDTTAPVIERHENVTVEATSSAGAVVNFTPPTANDTIDGPVTVTCSPASGSKFAIGDTTVACTATDAHNNTARISFIVTVIDTTAPVITVPTVTDTEATGPNGATVTFTAPTATDLVDGIVTVTSDKKSGDIFPLGTTTVHCSATDVNHNTANTTFTVTVVDTTKPVIAAPADILNVEATAILTPVDIGDATASDIFLKEVTNDAPKGGFKLGTTTVTWTATDTSGNISTATQLVQIVDTTKPELSVPSDLLNIEATDILTPVNIGDATASDIFLKEVTSDAPKGGFKLGTTTVTWTATDTSGNTSTATQSVRIVDTTKPELSVPSDLLNIEATDILTPVNIGDATASDIFLKEVTSDAPKDGFKLGTTIVTWTATDTSGNISTATQSVQIVDTTKPELSVPSDIIVTITGVLTQVNIGTATASDIFLKEVTNDAPKDGFKLGTTTVIWTATDSSGNTRTAVQKVTVKYAFGGILQPINTDGTSVFKKGCTVPVKFQLRDANGNIISDAKGVISYVKVSNIPESGINEAIFTDAVSTGNVFRYDASSQQYIFNLNTKSMDAGEYMVKIDLGDNTPQYVKIGLK